MSNRDMSETTMELLGKILPKGTGRDAIHIAVCPAIANTELWPGENIGLKGQNEDGEYIADSRVTLKVGIVDPYLHFKVKKGERFFIYLYPRTITSLRHEWTHPSFPEFDKPPSDDEAITRKALDALRDNSSEKWLKQHANNIGVTYEELKNAAERWIAVEDHTILNYDTPPEVWDHNDEFWKHYEAVTGKKISQHKKQPFFSCSC